MTKSNNPRTAAWAAFNERIAERDKLRDRIADIGALAVKQAELVASAPAHNEKLVQDEIAADLDGAKKPTSKPINLAFEQAKLEALQERLSDARSELPNVQSNAEYLLARSKDADRDALEAWSRATLNFSSAEPLDGRTSKMTVAQLCDSFVQYRAGGGHLKFAEFMDQVISFEGLEDRISEQRTVGLSWFDQNFAKLEAEAAE